MTPDQIGISGSGRDAETRFLQLTGAERTPKAARGDAVVDGNFVEIKRATKTTLNQVRAVKYIVLIAYYCPDGAAPCCYVVPAHRVVALVARKTRGQHTENPFESATLNIRDLADYRVDDEAQLRTQVLAAVRDSARYTDLQAEMTRILRESRSLASDSRERVSAVLHHHGIA